MWQYLQVASVPLLILANAFFVAAEYALVTVRTGQIDALRKAGAYKAAAAITTLKENLAGAIGATQVGITVVSLLLGWIGEPAMGMVLERFFSPLHHILGQRIAVWFSVGVSFFIVTLLTVVLGELMPKALTLQNTQFIIRYTAWPLLMVMRLIRPMTWLVNGTAEFITRLLGLGSVEIEAQTHSAEEIGVIATEAGEAGKLTPREKSLIINSLALGRKTAEQVMVPRVRVAYLDLTRSMDENMKTMNAFLYSRLPLCDGGLDKVIGVVYTKEFLTAYQEPGSDSSVLSLIARPAVFVPVNVALDKLLAVFRERHTHMAFLVDEYGGMEGLCTLTDVVDEVVGEINEGDGEPAARTEEASVGGAESGPIGSESAGEGEQSSDTAGTISVVVSGRTTLSELAAKVKRDGWVEEESVHTVGGLLSARLGHVPLPGEEIVIENLRLRVLESTRRQVGKVRVTCIPKLTVAEDGTSAKV